MGIYHRGAIYGMGKIIPRTAENSRTKWMDLELNPSQPRVNSIQVSLSDYELGFVDGDADRLNITRSMLIRYALKLYFWVRDQNDWPDPSRRQPFETMPEVLIIASQEHKNRYLNRIRKHRKENQA